LEEAKVGRRVLLSANNLTSLMSPLVTTTGTAFDHLGPRMSTATFFAEQTMPSRTKARIVSDYFDAWASIVQKAARRRGQFIAYLDLFAGRGEYEDGAESTPLMVLRKAVRNPKYRDLLVARFNDADPGHAAALRAAIGRVPGLALLRKEPEVFTEVVDARLAAGLEAKNLPPCLVFADPCGYKGLTRRLVRAALRSWGSEVILFFNFNRVNAAVSNPVATIAQHIDELFGPEEAADLRQRVDARDEAGRPRLSPRQREEAVVAQLLRSLRGVGGEYGQHFCFDNPEGTRTSHYLVHVTKNLKGHNVMKDVMGRASPWATDGVPSFWCGPKPAPDLFSSFDSPLDELKRLLLADCSGRRATVGELWQQHGAGRPFIERNYKDAVRELEEAGRVVIECPAGRRRPKRFLPDWLVVHFPITS
jgi:three-Cys-motif partner protein